MGKYTILEDPSIDNKIDEILNLLVNQIVGVFQPESVILSGSFGRGEGTVLCQNGDVNIISDFEIGVISRKYYKRFLCSKISQKISRKLNIGLTLNFYLPSRFTKNKVANLSGRMQYLTIDQYELRYCSKLLYGKDYINEMKNYSPENIPIWEGLRLIFNRIAELLEYFPPGEDKSKEYLLKKWIYKTILACSDALLISLGKHHFLCTVRLRNFIYAYTGHFEKLFNDLVPEFPDLVKKATSFRLKPYISGGEDLSKLWFQTTGICDIVLSYLAGKEMKFKYSDYLDFQQKYLAHPNLKKKYFRGLTGVPLYQNILSLVRMGQRLKGNKVRRLPCLFLGVPLVHLLYSTITLLYFALQPGDEFNSEYLEKAQHNLERLTRSHFSSKLKASWFEARDLAVALWNTVCN